MSIRMIILTDAETGEKFRIAAHAVTGYHPFMGATRILGTNTLVKETMEELDRYFLVTPYDWFAKHVDEQECMSAEDGLTIKT